MWNVYSVSLLEGQGGRAGAWPRVSRGSNAHQTHLDPEGDSFIKDIKDENMN